MVSSSDISKLIGPLNQAVDDLNIPDETKGRASEILRTVSDDEISTHAHGPDNVGAAALLIACREQEIAVTMTEVVEAWSPVTANPETGQPYSHSSVGRAFNHLSRTLDISTQPTTPETLVERTVVEQGLTEQTQAIANNILGAVRTVDSAAVGAKTSKGPASAALYLATQLSDEDESTQSELAENLDTNEVTLRTNKTTIMEVLLGHPELSGLPEPSSKDHRQYESVNAEQFLELEQIQSASTSAPTAGEKQKEYIPNTAVLFGDIRNFTSIVQLHDGAYAIINELFQRIEETVTDEYGGEVEKLLGDGILAVWTGEEAASKAISCAVAVLEEELPELRPEASFDLEMGFGIASGELWRVDIGDVERTVFGENVNFAARLEGLCKRFDSRIVVDSRTAEATRETTSLYRIPNRDIQGLNEPRNVFIRPTQTEVEPSDIDRFNQATADLEGGFYAEALEFFASMYGDSTQPYNQQLIQQLAVECFDKFERGSSRSRTEQTLYTFTETQYERSRPLKREVESELSDLSVDSPRVLEVGCGGGELITELAQNWESVTFVGIDTSPDAIETATTANPENVRFRRTSPDRLRETEAFDIVYLNSPLYSESAYLDTIRQVRDVMTRDGLLVLQQAPAAFDQKLRESTTEAAVNMGYESIFEQFDYPLKFFGAEEIINVLENRHWEPTVDEEIISYTGLTRIQDFAEVGLTPYTECFSNTVEKEKFKSEFKNVAQSISSSLDQKVLLVTATPQT